MQLKQGSVVFIHIFHSLLRMHSVGEHIDQGVYICIFLGGTRVNDIVISFSDSFYIEICSSFAVSHSCGVSI